LIYVKRDAGLIPLGLLARATEAQATLETLPPEQREDFIKTKSDIWRAFKAYLSQMSYGKCWYSESPEVQSFLDVDHYRPKLEAKRSDAETDPGYGWLAFSWENFRLAAQRSNRPNANEETGETEGKGSWFPLMNGSPKACWDNRCETKEYPVLLDPIVRRDVDLIDVGADGKMCPSQVCIGAARERVHKSIELYGLNLPKLVGARKRVMRELVDIHTNLSELVEVGKRNADAADELPINRHIEQLRRATLPSSPYSKAARAKLVELGASAFCAQPEDLAAPAGL
jgi:hypothetical protein